MALTLQRVVAAASELLEEDWQLAIRALSAENSTAERHNAACLSDRSPR